MVLFSSLLVNVLDDVGGGGGDNEDLAFFRGGVFFGWLSLFFSAVLVEEVAVRVFRFCLVVVAIVVVGGRVVGLTVTRFLPGVVANVLANGNALGFLMDLVFVCLVPPLRERIFMAGDGNEGGCGCC